jgi:hypothetical protein
VVSSVVLYFNILLSKDSSLGAHNSLMEGAQRWSNTYQVYSWFDPSRNQNRRLPHMRPTCSPFYNKREHLTITQNESDYIYIELGFWSNFVLINRDFLEQRLIIIKDYHLVTTWYHRQSWYIILCRHQIRTNLVQSYSKRSIMLLQNIRLFDLYEVSSYGQ